MYLVLLFYLSVTSQYSLNNQIVKMPPPPNYTQDELSAAIKAFKKLDDNGYMMKVSNLTMLGEGLGRRGCLYLPWQLVYRVRV